MEFTEPVREKALRHAVEAGMKRYPYFAVKIVRCAENWVLEENNRSFVISPENKTVCLGSEEANGYLVDFAYEGNAVSIDMSHYIADGTGMTPLFKTIAWHYLKESIRRQNWMPRISGFPGVTFRRRRKTAAFRNASFMTGTLPCRMPSRPWPPAGGRWAGRRRRYRFRSAGPDAVPGFPGASAGSFDG